MHTSHMRPESTHPEGAGGLEERDGVGGGVRDLSPERAADNGLEDHFEGHGPIVMDHRLVDGIDGDDRNDVAVLPAARALHLGMEL